MKQKAPEHNIFSRIETDHQVQRNLMEKLLNTSGDTVERQQLFSNFVAEFRAHAAAEEHAFYAPMLELPETTGQSRHSVAEHHEAMELIEQLQKTDMSSPAWIATFKKLADENEHHMQEEEQDVFNSVRQEMSATAIDGMLETFEKRKKEELNA
jgi:iron-sulfur cluster repair protein YtfE (RIC family)